jgi:NTP pyrophosphatase (non-canonical NTP hydrolase)
MSDGHLAAACPAKPAADRSAETPRPQGERWTHPQDIYELEAEIDRADRRYGDYASTHEALGVLAEEYHELVAAIRANKSESIRAEAIQVAAVAIRMVRSLDGASMRRRSGCA